MLALLCAALLVPSSAPAFLDARDTIKIWIPNRVDAKGPMPDIKVTLEGRSVEVANVSAAGLIAEPAKPRPGMVVLAGSLQHLLGGSDWAPGDETWEMKEVTPGVFDLLLRLPKGHFDYKVAVGGTWNVNYGAGFKEGGGNAGIAVPTDGTPVRFRADFNAKKLADSVNDPAFAPVPEDAPTTIAKGVPDTVNVLKVSLAHPIAPSEVSSDLEISVAGGETRRVFMRDVLDDPTFLHPANDLGAVYSRAATTFSLWSPVSSSVALDFEGKAIPMHRNTNGTWRAILLGDLHGKRYRYRLKSYGESRVAADVNCRAASPDGRWSVVVDPTRSNPTGWSVKPLPVISPTKLTIYEAHIRDFTIDPSSGVPSAWRGKYLGMTFDTGRRTGLNYLKWLGVNAVQIMPFQMFNPGHKDNYDWGYDPNLFNVPEPYFSTHPSDPVQTIREAKSMVSTLHKSGMRVFMDVVYNHSVPSEGAGSAFWQTVPYYYFRTDDRGTVLNESGVGNALDDDHPIVRKYIRESLCYWAKEYAVDGFRFDLLGMFTKASVTDWRAALNRVRPGIVMYGEPWTGGGPLRFGKGDQQNTGVGVFNDNFRNAIRGELDGPAPGFAMGGTGLENAIIRGLRGSIDDFTAQPLETINYVSAHDNMTLWDKICLSMPKASMAERKSSLKLCGALVLLAQGVPFLEGGAEIGRTKGGNNNTYNRGDVANRFDWKRAESFMDVASAYRELIRRRSLNPSLVLSHAEEIAKGVHGTIEGGVKLEAWKGTKGFGAFFNGSNRKANPKLPGWGGTVAPMSYLIWTMTGSIK